MDEAEKYIAERRKRLEAVKPDLRSEVYLREILDEVTKLRFALQPRKDG